jgi:cytochrome c551/c552
MKLSFSIIVFLIIILVYRIMEKAENLKSEELILNQQVIDKGIGPVKNLELGPIDMKMVSQGKTLFNNKCLLCHDLDQKKIGPPIRNITKTRAPEFIMNLLLNTVQMQQEDPVIKDLISTYKVPMTPPEFSKEQARSVLEYLRSVAR